VPRKALLRRHAEAVPDSLPEPIRYESHRDFVREVLGAEVNMSAAGTEFIDKSEETADTRSYRDHMNSDGSPSDIVAAGYVWMPGSELVAMAANGHPAGPSASPRRQEE
jgi:hypothetical protein